MMMKLTVAFLATLAAADAAQAHGRRHIRRADYGYGNGYGYGGASSSSSAVFPIGTGAPSSSAAPSSVVVDTPLPSSTALPVEGTTGVPSLTGGFQYPGAPSGSVGVPGPSGSVVVPPVPSLSSVVADSASVAVPATTAAPVESVPFPSGTGVSFPVTGAVNATGTAPGEYVITSTIYSTQIFTLTMTVPGEADTTKLITSVVPVATSTCTKTSGVPDTTAVPVESAPISEIVHVTTETLTYTVGVGSTAHPVTTEIVQTSTETIYKTIVITAPGPAPTGVDSEGSVVPVEGPSGTTVISSTSTTTKFITVYPTPSGVPVDSEGSVVAPVPTGPAGECAPPLTVTITAKETITVTAGQEVPVTTAAPEATTSAVIVEVPSSTLAVPYPLGNSTVVVPNGSTGFVTFTKPVGPSGGVPVPTGTAPPAPATTTVGTEIPSGVPGTSGLPSFALPSEVAVPSSAALPVESVPAASSTVVSSAAATPSSDYSYGSYRKRSNL